ncbi:ParA family protein [Desulfoplanes sp.]
MYKQNKIIAVLNNKGGTGKTTTSVNLSAFLALQGHRVLLIDMDSQASASIALGLAWHELSPSLADLIQGTVAINGAIHRTQLPSLDIIPGAMDLANTDIMLADMPGREQFLQRLIVPIRSRYDYIVCDCPPSLSLLPVNALVCADYYLVPMAPEYLALEGLISLQEAIGRLCGGMELRIKLLGILLTMVQPWSWSQRRVINLVRDHYRSQIFNSVIARESNLCTAPSHGCDIFSFKKRSKGARLYRQTGREVLQRLSTDLR